MKFGKREKNFCKWRYSYVIVINGFEIYGKYGKNVCLIVRLFGWLILVKDRKIIKNVIWLYWLKVV